MKTFFLVWISVIIFGWALLNLFGMFFGEMGLLLLATLVIAVPITGLVSLIQETDELRQRVKALEEAAAPKDPDAPDTGSAVTADEP